MKDMFCCLSRQKYASHDKTSVATKLCLLQQIFVVTNIKHNSVTTKVLLQQAYFCQDKTSVATKMILVAAPANDRL